MINTNLTFLYSSYNTYDALYYKYKYGIKQRIMSMCEGK